MERVLKQVWFKSLLLLIFLLGAAQSSLATTAIIPSDDDMIVGSRAIVRGRVVSVGAAFDDNNRIFTYTTLEVSEVFKGQITEHRITLKEPGGWVGTQGSIIFGSPEFTPGEDVFLYLGTWPDGS